ncbi:MAG TPA: hypothetical protein VLL52_11710, partial [Anaerolineae bacterium]|nr:hypothetical protein [Anaerolineae bacterium]
GPRGEKIVTVGSVGEVVMWEAGTGQALWAVKGHRIFGCDGAWSPDGRLVATCALHQEAQVIVWDVATGEPVQFLVGGGQGVSWSRDGNWLALAGEREIVVWSTKDWSEVGRWARPDQDLYTIAFSPDSRWLLVGYKIGPMELISTQQWAVVRQWLAHGLGGVADVSWRGDSQRWATVTSSPNETTVKVWGLGQVDPLLNLPFMARDGSCVIWCDEGEFLATSHNLADGKGDRYFFWDVRV